MNIKIKLLLTFLAGTALVLAYQPFNWVIIATLAPAVLFYLLLDADSRKQHIFLVWAFCFGMFSTGTYWIYYSVHFFGGAHWSLALLLSFLFVSFISSFIIPLGFLTYWARKKSIQSKLLLIYPATWVLVEWFRGWFLTGFPWLRLGQSQTDTWLAHIAPITGVLGVSWLVALLAGAIVLLIIGSNNRQRIIAVSLSLVVLSASFALDFIHWTQPNGKPIKVALLQGNVAQENKWKPEYRQPTLDMYLQMTEKSWDNDLIIWPETAIPGWFGEVAEQVIEPLRAASIIEQSDLLVGGFSYNPQTKQTYNSIMAITKDGSIDIYSKQHRVPFSEYIPFLEYLRFMEDWIMLPYDSIGKGQGKTTLQVAGQIAQMSICYEDVYGDESINGLPQASMLINLSNDGWFAGSIEPMQHMQIARMRAIESGRYLLRATNTGISGIINEKGQIIATAAPYKNTIITAKAQGFRGSTPYIIWGDSFIMAIMLGVFGIASVTRR